MKTRMNAARFLLIPRRRAGAKGGVALILTLAMLVLLSGLVLAFMLTVRTEYGASKSYEGGTNARLLADSALNLVIGQIREASTQPDQAWISQPGLMRTFDTNGKAVKSYKLYSTDSLVEDGSFDPAKGTDLPAADSWKSQPGLWTDLNAPVTDLAHTNPFDPTKKLMVYPIFDGVHINAAGQFSLNKDVNADIEGFTVNDYANRGVTMPVKWLYILKDGTLAPATASGTQGDVQVLVPAGRGKTAQGDVNSIVGRVAFWTDDETAKVNINTASEGTFWDTPVANSQPGIALPAVSYVSSSAAPLSNDCTFEWDLAERQGAQKEYQRYPGHPATTCLSTIFGRQLLLGFSGDRALMIEEINKFIPRVTGVEYDSTDPLYESQGRDHSSKGGTKRAGPEGELFNRGQASQDETAYPVTPDGDRLYATIDEFLYNPNFGPETRNSWQLAPTAAGRDTTRRMLEMAKFFVTASSKAPEQNLFNLPRISIWPEQVSDTRRTTFDKLIAFCSTVGPTSDPSALPFYFTRQNANDPTADVPSGSRNLALMAYLKGLTGRAFPGWDTSGTPAKTFQAKYGADCNQILTEIFDYIRCTNLVDRSDPNVASSYTNSVEGPLGTVPPAGDQHTGLFPPSFASASMMGPHGQVVPVEMPDGTRGIGRIATISELALDMYGLSSTDKTATIKFSLLPKLFCPMAGYCSLANGLRITFKSINIKVTDMSGATFHPFGPADGTTQPTLYDIGRLPELEDLECKLGGTIGLHVLYESGQSRNWPRNVGAPPDSKPPSGDATVSTSGSGPDKTLTIEGSVVAEITATAQNTPVNSTGEPVIQSITFNFPTQKVPLPDVGGTLGAISGGDTVRSLVAVGTPGGAAVGLQGDMRLIAARHTVDQTYFAPAPNGAYADVTRQNNQMHSMRLGWNEHPLPGAANGFLVQSITNYSFANLFAGQPDIPPGINGVLNSLGQPGDWDNGPAFVPDGAYCAKADEGTRRHLHGSQSKRDRYAQGDLGGDMSAPYIGYYYNPEDAMANQSTFFSPNRQVPSAVMFGSLPTGVLANKPWQTLLFRPAKSYLPGGASHPGSAAWGPPDHLLLDLFWMPVVEPYAISEPFATGGKINLNQQIAPFTNIRRDTGLRAVLKSVKITAMNPNQPDNSGGVYSQQYKLCGTLGAKDGDGGGQGVVIRRSIDLDNTLKQISDRLDKNKPFISASEICDIPLIPLDLPASSGPVSIPAHVKAGFTTTPPYTPLSNFDSLLTTFWAKHKLTGDNSLERPYAHIYPRLTTRSNTYTVHVRVQLLAQNTRNNTFILKASQSQPTGEFRGSFLIERYLDANSAGFVDSTGAPVVPPVSGNTTGLALGPYRFRVVSSKQFVP